MSQQVPRPKKEEQRHDDGDDKLEVDEKALHQVGREWEGVRLQKQEETQMWRKTVSPQRK